MSKPRRRWTDRREAGNGHVVDVHRYRSMRNWMDRAPAVRFTAMSTVRHVPQLPVDRIDATVATTPSTTTDRVTPAFGVE